MIFEVKPNLTKTNEGKNYAEFVVEPLPGGFGLTLGHALRRVLLTSLEGFAITSIKVVGAKHEFTAIKGIKEDMIDLVLNIKNIRVFLDSKEEVVITLEKKGAGQVTAADIKCPAGVRILNPEQYITTLADKNTKLKIEFRIQAGKGYVSAEEQEIDGLGVIPIDGIYTPVIDADYKVEDTRVGGKTNFDKLTLMVTTTGGIQPEDAVEKAAEILREYYNFIVNQKII